MSTEKQVPLPELLKDVPTDLRIGVPTGNEGGMTYLPVGQYCVDARSRILALEEQLRLAKSVWEQDHERLVWLYSVNSDLLEALQGAVQWGAPFKDAPRATRPGWFDAAQAVIAKVERREK